MKILLPAICLLTCLSSAAQSPVTWKTSVRKIKEKTYDISFTAIIQKGWHTFSQTQPKDALPVPTRIGFTKNPVIELSGKIKERGMLEKYKEKLLGFEQHQYSDSVVFVQRLMLRTDIKTNISGTITYQACDQERCLPPKTVPFNMAIEK